MKTTKNNPSVYVGTYEKYNNGNLFGEWVDLTDFKDKDEFIEYCKELHKDEYDPEFMFQDYEYIPEICIDESYIDEDFFDFINLDEHEQKQVLIYHEATGYDFNKCMLSYEDMSYFHSEDTEQMFFEFYPDLKKFENNPYINIDFERFTDDFTEVEIDKEIYFVDLH
jgi:antirestriction protein